MAVAPLPVAEDAPRFRYGAALANEIEAKWQDRWDAEGTYHAPNPSGDLSEGFERVASRPRSYILDMFPYPSGSGLHVGHPLGYIATDVYARFLRMTGRNVLHAMGYDAFGLPAEQYAVQTGQHPRVTTERNIEEYRRQIRAMGLGHDPRRSVTTMDVGFYRWTQWIFLQLYGAWFDPEQQRARPIGELEAELAAGPGWGGLSERERRVAIDGHRLVYRSTSPVNWCPGLGTVLANEEVTADGRSDRGNFPVFKRPLEQWMMRITAYAERLLDDLGSIDWPEPIKLMQRNWIGRSTGATVRFPVPDGQSPMEGTSIEVFTTRPDTLFGATYVVLAPEHPLVDALVPSSWPEGVPDAWKGPEPAASSPAGAVDAYRRQASTRSDIERQVESREKTGVFTGATATNPANGEALPVFVADYVLVGYGTGAIMAVPGQDQRDWDFAEAFGLPIVRTVQPPEGWVGEAYLGEGPAVNSGFLNGLHVVEAKARITAWLEAEEAGRATVTYRLRDWLFSRQRYWGEPFPVVYDETGLPVALPESMLPVELPELDDYAPVVVGEGDDSVPEPPLARATEWVDVTLDLGDGPKRYRRETNTMPQWAGSCWYYLRYLDPDDDAAFVDPEIERYWMEPGGVDLYVGGVEHAVLHLLYARFWHKVLFDLGHVSTPEPFARLFNQGYVLAPAYLDARGMHVPADEVEADGQGGFRWQGEPVDREMGKMGKSLKNSVSPETIYDEYGADTLRLYEMAMGPLDAARPWNARDIVGQHRFLQRVWRALVDEDTGALRVSDEATDDELRRALHRTVAGVREDMAAMRCNTAIAKLIELTNRLTPQGAGPPPREVADALVRMLAPLAPHLAEELWSRMGGDGSVVWADFPVADPALLVEDEVELPVQVGGKVRSRVRVAADADAEVIEAAALADEAVVAAIAGRPVKRVVVVPGRLVNVVV